MSERVSECKGVDMSHALLVTIKSRLDQGDRSACSHHHLGLIGKSVYGPAVYSSSCLFVFGGFL